MSNQAFCLLVNGFNIYKDNNVIRIKEVDFSMCLPGINIGDVLIKVDNISVSNWPIRNLIKYIYSNKITSVETQNYIEFNNNLCNNSNQINITNNPSVVNNNNNWTFTIDDLNLESPSNTRGPYKKKIKNIPRTTATDVHSTTTPDIISIDSNNNLCNASGTFLVDLVIQ